MAQVLMILALGTVLTNVTRDTPFPWPWQPDLCQAFGCQEPAKQAVCGHAVYNNQTHLCCMNSTAWKVMEKPSPVYDCCGFQVYDQTKEECCEDLSIKTKRDCGCKGEKTCSHNPRGQSCRIPPVGQLAPGTKERSG